MEREEGKRSFRAELFSTAKLRLRRCKVQQRGREKKRNGRSQRLSLSQTQEKSRRMGSKPKWC